MPVTGYDETTIKTFFLTELSTTGTALGWTTGTTEVVQAVSDLDRILGVSDLADATDMVAVEAVGRVVIWRWAVRALINHYDITTVGQALKRSQHYEHAVAMLLDAEREALAYLPSYRVAVDAVIYTQDPYGPIPYDQVVYP